MSAVLGSGNWNSYTCHHIAFLISLGPCNNLIFPLNSYRMRCFLVSDMRHMNTRGRVSSETRKPILAICICSMPLDCQRKYRKNILCGINNRLTKTTKDCLAASEKESPITKLVVDKNHQRYNHARQQKHKLGCRYDTQCLSHDRVAIGEQQQK